MEKEMSLSNYLSNFSGLRVELSDMLSDDDIDSAFSILEKTTQEEWMCWIYDTQDLLLRFISQTPSQRKKKVPWKNERERVLFLVAAVILARRSYTLAEVAERILGVVGLPYRKALAYVGEELALLEDGVGLLWPFPGKTPWGEESAVPFPRSFPIDLDFPPQPIQK